MSYTSGLREFKERPVHVACPVCSHRASQKAGKMRKDAVLECPSCGLLFRPSECGALEDNLNQGHHHENQESCFY